MPRSAGPEDVAGTERDTGVIEEPAGGPGKFSHHGKSVGGFFVKAELSAIEPRKVSALRS